MTMSKDGRLLKESEEREYMEREWLRKATGDGWPRLEKLLDSGKVSAGLAIEILSCAARGFDKGY